MGDLNATTIDEIKRNIAKAFMMNRIPITVVADIVGIHVDSVVDWCNMIESDVSDELAGRNQILDEIKRMAYGCNKIDNALIKKTESMDARLRSVEVAVDQIKMAKEKFEFCKMAVW